MLYDTLWEIAERADWSLMIYKGFAIGAFVVTAVLIWNINRIWKRMRRIETQLGRIEKKVNILQMQESRRLMRLMMELKAKSRAKIDLRGTAVEMGGGGVAGLTISPPTAPAKPEGQSRQKCLGTNTPMLRRNPFPMGNTLCRPTAVLCTEKPSEWERL